MSKQKVLIIGGTGFIGRNLLKEFPKDEFDVFVTSRKKRESSFNPQYLKVNLFDKNNLKKVFEQNEFEIIIQCVQFDGHPVERPWLGPEHTYLGFDAVVTENIISALKDSKNRNCLKRFVYLSGAGIECDSMSEGYEDYNWSKAKRIAEKAVKESGLPFTIFRPSWIYGKGDKSMSMFVELIRYVPLFPQIGDGQNPVNPLCIKDLTRIIFNSLNSPEAVGQTYVLGSPTNYTMDEVVKTIMKVLGKERPIIYHPLPLMKFIGTFTQFIPGFPISPDSVEFITMDVTMKDLKEELFGVKIKNFEEGLLASGLI
jgi:NADH dehydrogenase